jgi:hypothetical protein
MLPSNAVQTQFIKHVILLATAAVGALQNMKPASTKNFTILFFIPTFG